MRVLLILIFFLGGAYRNKASSLIDLDSSNYEEIMYNFNRAVAIAKIRKYISYLEE